MQKLNRFLALDRLRGIAVIAMILAHFGPGFYERAGFSGLLLDVLLFLGRLATPAFILIFGITLAFVYVPKAKIDPKATRQLLFKRAGLVLVCALIVELPSTVETLIGGATGAQLLFELALAQYSVLIFYAIAIFVSGALIQYIARNVLVFGLSVGPMLVFVGNFLGFDAWPPQPGTATEVVRLVLVSGHYGVFVLLGAAFMVMVIGHHIRSRLEAGLPFHREVLIAAAAMLFVGLGSGRVVGWREISDLPIPGPPQLWYLATVSGIMLLMLVAVDRDRVPAGAVLEGIGRSALSIYVAHSFVLPAVALLRYFLPAVPDLAAILVCLAVFGAFVAYKIWPRRSLQSPRHSPHAGAAS